MLNQIMPKNIMPEENSFNQTTFLILAGGEGKRMQGVDKGLMQWQDRPMIEHVTQHINAPKAKIIISANRNIDAYKTFAAEVVRDDDAGLKDNYQGPLTGIFCAMQKCETPYLLCLPCDSPTPPDNLLKNLWHCLQAQNKTSALCHDGNRLQPLFSLLACQHQALLYDFLQQGRRKVHDFMNLIDPAICDFSAQKDHFNNFNHPEDLH
jgi:molybdenum cofactor guanylyltransferase